MKKVTETQRHSIDSMDSMEMELAGSESLENRVSNPVPTPPSTKKAIILPILGKKKNLATPTSAAATVTATAVPSPSFISGTSSVSKENSSKIYDADLCTTADSKMSKSEFAESSSAKKRGPGRPKKVKSSDTVITLDSDQPPELEPQVTIPPIKKRLQVNNKFYICTIKGCTFSEGLIFASIKPKYEDRFYGKFFLKICFMGK